MTILIRSKSSVSSKPDYSSTFPYVNGKLVLLCILFMLTTTFKSFCCTCAPPFYFNFIDASLHPIYENNPGIIVQAKVISFSPDNYFMEVDIIEEIQGQLTNKKIIVAGQDGMNCAVPLGMGLFNLTDTVIFRLTSDFYNRADTFELNDCGLNFLNYSDGHVLGNITRKETEMNYSLFKSLINSENVNSLIENQPANDIALYPNPANDYLMFENVGGALLDIYIYDLTGKLIIQISDLTVGNIDISNLESGVYIIQIFTKRGHIKKVEKFVKNKGV